MAAKRKRKKKLKRERWRPRVVLGKQIKRLFEKAATVRDRVDRGK